MLTLSKPYSAAVVAAVGALVAIVYLKSIQSSTKQERLNEKDKENSSVNEAENLTKNSDVKEKGAVEEMESDLEHTSEAIVCENTPDNQEAKELNSTKISDVIMAENEEGLLEKTKESVEKELEEVAVEDQGKAASEETEEVAFEDKDELVEIASEEKVGEFVTKQNIMETEETFEKSRENVEEPGNQQTSTPTLVPEVHVEFSKGSEEETASEETGEGASAEDDDEVKTQEDEERSTDNVVSVIEYNTDSSAYRGAPLNVNAPVFVPVFATADPPKPQSIPLQSKVKLQRCRFFPRCTNKNCKFIHPSKPCRYYPNCVWGDRCIYLHPTETA
ncbi:uncharacterized protein VTP21DRAFT_8830 [Calcarisporiella thermophila]|uniref:uncharacterized protein n=1 Tax=Calcarisporiella thermophila TaxID=911321 RepID=UPI003743C50E